MLAGAEVPDHLDVADPAPVDHEARVLPDAGDRDGPVRRGTPLRTEPGIPQK